MIEYEEPLSPTGALRRERILQIAQRAARTRRNKRYFMRTAASAACVFAVVLILHRTQSPSMNIPPRTPMAQLPTSESKGTIMIERIETDPTIADRLSVLPRAAQWQQIGDDELLGSLAKAGQPAGLIRVDGQAILVTDSDSQP
jgi:hypothetical protein